PEHDEKRAEETEPKRVQHAAGARAEQQVDARDGENEYQPNEPGQTGARQILSDVEVAKIFLEQAVEAQAWEPALELLRIRRAVAVRIEPMYVHTKKRAESARSGSMRETRLRISNLGHKRDWFLSIQRQQRLGRRRLGGACRALQVDEHGRQPIAAPGPGCSPVDVRFEREDLVSDGVRQQR